MENERRKRGRPRTEKQSLPLVLSEDRSLETIEVALPEGTAKMLAEYVAWVRGCRDMRAEEALTATIDYALREVFRRDRLWRDHQRSAQAKGAAAPPAAPPVSPRLPTANPEPRGSPERRHRVAVRRAWREFHRLARSRDAATKCTLMTDRRSC